MTSPDKDTYAYSFSRGELSALDRTFQAIKNVKADQPTKESAVMGTATEPLARTQGEQELGSGTVEFSEEGERQAFIDLLGDGYRDVLWDLSWVLTAEGRPPIKFVAEGCRMLNDPLDHSQGTDAMGGPIEFSFMRKTRNGLRAHR